MAGPVSTATVVRFFRQKREHVAELGCDVVVARAESPIVHP
jgi:hypothetical protein